MLFCLKIEKLLPDFGFKVEIEIVGLNKLTYETKCITIQLFIDNKHQTPVNTVQMKIDNLNWVQLMDPGRVENLKNIFRYLCI